MPTHRPPGDGAGPGKSSSAPSPSAKTITSNDKDDNPRVIASRTDGKAKDYEDRRNAAACFRNQRKTEDWHADYLGLMVTEDLPAGTRVWVNVRKRLTRNGEVYVSVVLKRQEHEQKGVSPK